MMDTVIDQYDIEEVVCGGARGAQQFGQHRAQKNEIPCVQMNTKWNEFGKGAGMMRDKKVGRCAAPSLSVVINTVTYIEQMQTKVFRPRKKRKEK